MKILYITHLSENITIPINDLVSDSIFHGLKEAYKNNVIDYPFAWHMDNDEVKKRNYKYKNNFWGNGFTYYDLIFNLKDIDRTDILKKIINNYFDYIIYGSIKKSKKFLNEAINSKNKIIFIDGDDDTEIDRSVLKYGIYFKRELAKHNYSNVFPLNCSIPEKKIIKKLNYFPNNLLAPLIPGRKKTYIYENEKEYYKMWQNSLFGITYNYHNWWEAIRYYEMLMNGCIPLILELEKCPINTLTKLPKSNLINIYNKYSWILNKIFPPIIFKKRYLNLKKFLLYFKSYFQRHYNAKSFLEDYPEVNDVRVELLNYTRKYLTTIYAAEELIDISNKFFMNKENNYK